MDINQTNEEIELSEDELLAAIKESGLSKSFQIYMKKELQREGDRRLTDGLKTYQKNQGAKNLNDKERLEAVETELAQMKENTAKNKLNNSIKESLKKAGLSEGFAKYVKVEKEEDIEAAVKDLNDNILGLKQKSIDEKLKEGEPPQKGDITGAGSGMETAARAYAKKISVKE